MPVSIALPAPRVEFYSQFRWPLQTLNDIDGDNAELDDVHARQFPGSSAHEVDLAPDGGVSGSTPDFTALGGRTCAVMATDLSNSGSGYRPATWNPGYDPAAFAAGATYDPGSVVAIFDIHAALGATAFPAAAADEESGWLFLNDVPGGGTVFGTPPRAGAGFGGFGIFVRDDGAGDSEFTYVAYDGATVLQREVLTVADVTRWSTFRFTLIAATEAAEATLSLAVNGTNVAAVQGVPFDDVSLPRPRSLSAAAANIGWIPSYASGANMAPMFFQFYARFGRFTATGQQQQAP